MITMFCMFQFFGVLLGDAYASVKYQKYGETARFAFKQSIIHKTYLFYLYEFSLVDVTVVAVVHLFIL
jgi:LAGLIDADG DNA endonuclease family